MDDDRLIDAMARAIGMEAGLPDSNWDCEARAALAAIRAAKYAVVPVAQADRYAAIVREKRAYDKAFDNEWMDACDEAEDRLDDLIRAAAQEAKP